MRVHAVRAWSAAIVLVVTGAVFAAPAAAAPAPSAGPGWSVAASPNATRADGSLTQVQCPTADVCIAVGPWIDTAGRLAVQAQRSVGGVWKRLPIQQAPRSPGLTGLSCTSATWCLAVGSAGADPGQTTFAEVWDGTQWRIEATPNVPGFADTRFVRVSCVSPAFCLAVGTTSQAAAGTTTPVAAVRRDGVWSFLPTPPPAAGTTRMIGEFYDVSCTAVDTCTAVGYRLTPDRHRVGLVERWNGSGWTALPAQGSVLRAVDCVGTTCVAGGYYVGSRRGVIFRLRGDVYTGGRYFRYKGTVTSISCLSDTLCDAIGPGVFVKSIEGDQWRLPDAPPDSLATGIACRAGDHCIVVGPGPINAYYPGQSIASYAGRWDGHTWTRQPTADRIGVVDGGWQAVSCRVATACLALDVGPQTAAFRLADGAWSRIPDPGLPDAVRVHLDLISCGGADDCLAVGTAFDDIGVATAVSARWSGGTWTVAPIDALAGTTPSYVGLSCTAATRCELLTRGRPSPVAETWDGTGWTAHAAPSGFSDLAGLSCSGPRTCAVVGRDTGDAAALAIWNGATWTAGTFSGLSGSVFVSGVSCPLGGSTCTAVGTSYSDGHQHAVAAGGSGSTWTAQPVPPGAGEFGNSLTAVACAATDACTAIGLAYPFVGTAGALTYRWDGATWTPQDTPAAHLDRASVPAVSCPTVGTCVAVGSRRAAATAVGSVSLGEVWRGQSPPAADAAATRSRSALRGRQDGKP